MPTIRKTVSNGHRLLFAALGAAPPTQATTFSVGLSASSGGTGATVTVTYAPVGGVWPTGVGTLTPSVSGTLTGTFSPTTGSPSAGTSTAVALTFTQTSGASTSGTINGAISGMTSTGGQTYAVTGSTSATTFNVGINFASGVPSATPVLSFSPNGGTWPAGQTITPSASGGLTGTFGPSTLSPTSGTSTTYTSTFTETSGAGTNGTLNGTATSMTSTGGQSYSVVSAGGGAGNSSATMTDGSLFDTKQVFSPDVWTGNPSGYPTTWNNGWRAVPFKLTPSGAISTGVWMRLHNAEDGAATNSPNTGAVLMAPTQVLNSLSAGVNNVTIIVPAGRTDLGQAWFYADLALDAAMSHPVRVQGAFGVGGRIIIGPGTSHNYRWVMDGYIDGHGNSPSINTMVAVSPYGVMYAPSDATGETLTAGAGVHKVPGDGSPYITAFPAELMRLCINKTNKVWECVGYSNNGGDTEQYLPYSYVVQDMGTAAAAVFRSGETRYDAHVVCSGNNDLTLMTRNATMRRITGMFALFQSHSTDPNPPVCITTHSPMPPGANGSGTSRSVNLACRDAAAATPGGIHWDVYCSGANAAAGHSTQQGRLLQARDTYRFIMGGLGSAKGGFTMRRGPSITGATRSGTTITVTVSHDGGTALAKFGWGEPDPYTTAGPVIVDPTTITDSQMQSVPTIYVCGKTWETLDPVNVTQLSITSATTFTITLATDPGSSVPLDLYIGPDANTFRYGGTTRYALVDNATDSDGIAYGRPIRSTVDPIYVPAPTPASQTINISAPIATPAGAWACVHGTAGTGARIAGAGTHDPQTGLEMRVGGSGAFSVPDFLIVDNANRWSAFFQVGATTGTARTLEVRSVAAPAVIASTTIDVTSAVNALPSDSRGQALAQWDASNRGTLWSDAGKTTHPGDSGFVRAWDNALNPSDGNTLVAGDTNFPPYLDMRAQNFWPNQFRTVESTPNVLTVPNRDNRDLDRPCLSFESWADIATGKGRFLAGRNIPLLSSVNGTVSVLVVFNSGWEFASAIVEWGKLQAAPLYNWSFSTDPTFKIEPNNSGNAIGVSRFGSAGVSMQADSYPTPGPIISRCTTHMIVTYDATSRALNCAYVAAYNPTPVTSSVTAPADGGTSTYNTMLVGGGSSTGSGYPSVGRSLKVFEITPFSGVLTTGQQTNLFNYSLAKWTA